MRDEYKDRFLLYFKTVPLGDSKSAITSLQRFFRCVTSRSASWLCERFFVAAMSDFYRNTLCISRKTGEAAAEKIRKDAKAIGSALA